MIETNLAGNSAHLTHKQPHQALPKKDFETP
jgi:hypothetical protein